MVSVCFYFQVHQPFRLRGDFDFFSIGSNSPYEDDSLNASIIRKVATKCYLPTNRLIKELIHRHQGQFKVAYSITGTTLEQFEHFCPEVIETFKDLVNTGCVEILSETYYHSLASMFSKREFLTQVEAHTRRVQDLFGVTPKTFRNTELIYDNEIALQVEALGYRTILAEGTDHILGWRNPNYIYQPAPCKNLKLLLKNFRLSDDIAFRFSNTLWPGYPLTPEKYARWIHNEARNGQTVNLFMDYETFGEHQWAETGIFRFLKRLPSAILSDPNFTFQTPNEISETYPSQGLIDSPYVTSWADRERDISAWLDNDMQRSAMEYIFSLEDLVHKAEDFSLLHNWRKLSTSDHFYYMSTKIFGDGEVHDYFSPYFSPYDAYVTYINAVNHFREILMRKLSKAVYPMPQVATQLQRKYA